MENFKNDKNPDSLDLDELIKDYEKSTNEDVDVTRVFQPYTEKKVEKQTETESKLFLNINDIEDDDTGLTAPLEFSVNEEKDTPYVEEVVENEIPDLPELKSLNTNKKDKNLNIALTVVLSLIVIVLVFGIGFIGYKALFDKDEAPEPETPVVDEKPKDEPVEEKVDATRLLDLIDEAGKISPTYYTAASYANLQSALASAKITAQDDSLTYEELTEAISKLKEAMRNLELKDKDSAKPPVTPEEPDKEEPETPVEPDDGDKDDGDKDDEGDNGNGGDNGGEGEPTDPENPGEGEEGGKPTDPVVPPTEGEGVAEGDGQCIPSEDNTCGAGVAEGE